MQQIILFLLRSKNFLLFAFLLLLALIFTVQSHSYHRSKFVNSANFLAGGIYNTFGGIDDYFKLKGYNEQLIEENLNLRKQLFAKPISEQSFIIDSTRYKEQFLFIGAEVLNNSYARANNFITIKGGKKDSIQPDMGVITTKGIVGIVSKSSANYSTVLSMLHTDFETNAKLGNSNHFGTLIWDGENPNIAKVIDVQQQAPVVLGDTIETSGRSAIFPKGLPIGVIIDFELVDSENFYEITVELLNDMTNLGHVYIIKNTDLKEIQSLEAQPTNE